MTVEIWGDKLQPHDLDAEEALLGSLLIDADVLPLVAQVVKAEDFYQQKHCLCFEAALALFRRGDTIDQVTLAGELGRTGKLEIVGGMAYLSHLVSITPTSAHATHYAQAISRKATLRRLIKAGMEIVGIGYDETQEVDDSLRQAEEAIFRVRREAGRGFFSLREVYNQYLEARASQIDGAEADTGLVFTGFLPLDELLGGIGRSDMLVLGGRPSMGKSTLAVNIALNAARNGATVGIFSLEMSREHLAERILASAAEINSRRIRLGLYTEAEEARIIDAIGRLSALPMYIDDTSLQGTLEMQGKAYRLIREQGLDLLVVDYLQLIQGRNQRSENRAQEVSEISRSLKGIARSLEVPMLICSQLSRQVENRANHRPQLSDLRDSGSIEQDADVVMFIYREDAYYTEEEWMTQFPNRPYPKNVAEIIVAKQRHGPTGSIKLYFNDQWQRFDELEETR